MKIQPLAPGTGVQQTPQTSNNSAAKAKAVAAFMGGSEQPEAQVVQNQTQVSPEELGAIKAPTEQIQEQETTEAQAT